MKKKYEIIVQNTISYLNFRKYINNASPRV